MKHTREYATLLALLLTSLPTTAIAAPTERSALTDGRVPLDAIEATTSALSLAEAHKQLAPWKTSSPDSPDVLYQQGWLAFHEGKYAEALALIDAARANALDTRRTKHWQSLRDLVAETVATTEGYIAESSADGRYTVYYSPGADRVLVPYALEVLKAADVALESKLGVRLPGPLRLEVYPNAEALARVSTLTLAQIQTSGTIALCKWNRLMITSPRALAHGYPWADTINHELVHQYLSYATRDKASVWFQEGTAKLLERSWRNEAHTDVLEPSARALLTEAVRKQTLLTFDAMHPSIALLPSQEQAALAFAEVVTFMERFVNEHGLPALHNAITRIAAGEDARVALGNAANVSFAQLESGWRVGLKSLQAKSTRFRLGVRLKAKGATTQDDDDVVVETAKRFLKLGDMLWDTGRTRAAAAEYVKAQAADPEDPVVGVRLARASLNTSNAQQAANALSSHLSSYPSFAPARALLGQALLQLGDAEGARRELREAVLLNPFDPAPHCAWAKATANASEKAREQQACDTLKQR